jgi:hypothetical protein
VSLEHVYWIGGGSGAGKSTVARRLAERYGLDYYSTDDAMADHARRSTATDSPFLHDFIAMDMDQRWLLRDPGTMLETFHWFRGEGFGRIVDDLRDRPPVVAEGFRLLPHLVAPLLADRNHAVWLLPTPEFREAAFAGRGSMWQIAGQTSDPEHALRNLLDRDRMFTDRLRDEVRGLHAIEVGVAITAEELTAQVAAMFRLR